MKKLKIMFIDDELLVLEDLKTLIDWNALDIEIVASTTSSVKALNLFTKYSPDIVITDVSMPIKGGIKLSRELLAINPNVHVILLTAYKDFDVAQEAISIGVECYLVKHEVDRENMTEVINRIIKKNNKQRRKLSKIRQNDLKIVFDTKNHEMEMGHNELKEFDIKRLLMITYQIERPYHFLNIYGSNIDEFSDSQKIKEFNIETVNEVIDRFQVDERTWMLFFDVSNKGEEFCSELLARITNQLHSYYEDSFGETVSLVYIYTDEGIKGLKKNYSRCLESLKYRIFIGRNMLSDVNKVLQMTNNHSIHTRKEIQIIYNLVYENNVKDLEKGLHEFFKKTYKPQWNLEALGKVCRRLIDLLDFIQVDQGFKTIEDQLRSKEIELMEMYTVKEIEEWFIALFRKTIHSVNDDPRSKWPKKIIEAVCIIEKEYMRDISLVDIAKQLEFSGVYFSRLFKKETGKNFMEYLTEYRIAKAKSLLKNSDGKIYMIANQVGYQSSTYFSRVFTKQVGMTPKQYREL